MDIQALMQQFAASSPGGAAVLGGSQGGAPAAELLKALEASNYQTDVATLTGSRESDYRRVLIGKDDVAGDWKCTIAADRRSHRLRDDRS